MLLTNQAKPRGQRYERTKIRSGKPGRLPRVGFSAWLGRRISVNLELYNSELRCKTNSMLSGQREEMIPNTHPVFQIGVLKAFLADDDLQEITICSTNIGFVKTFTKSFRRERRA